MSNIPDNIKTAINDYASGRGGKPMVIKGAEYGYSLAAERIAELERENEWLKTEVKILTKAVNNPPKL